MIAGRVRVSLVVLALCLTLAPAAVAAAPLELHAAQFPEKRPVALQMEATPIAPTASIDAEVTYRQGQARIQMAFEKMKPAILFGGDVTCFVVWAVTRDGQAENLGELLTSKARGKLSFSTGKKNFALMVTAESFYLVAQPSELVAFKSLPVPDSTPFTFDNLAAAPRHNMDGIAHIKWDSDVPIELLQARKAFELATRHDAATHAAEIYTEAETALAGANEIAKTTSKGRDLLDASRRAVALSNEAFNISLHRIAAIEMEQQLKQRREETAALEARAAEAEAAAQAAAEAKQAAEQMAREVHAEAERVRAEKERTVAETDALRREKATLESTMLELRQDKVALETHSSQLMQDKSALEVESQRLLTEKASLQSEADRLRDEKAQLEQFAAQLQQEKNELTGRLEGALSHVADTQQSGRGLVVNLGDILFDSGEDALKVEAQVLLAKLSGILLLLPKQAVRVEGHTDSTGEAAFNLDLSERRARAVLAFLQMQGLDVSRLESQGLGASQPVADNATSEGRAQNRRVEIVITDTEAVAAR